MTYRTSTGLAELDNILDGGGQLVNTSLLIQEDHFNGDIARAVVRYWCAEGLSQHHHLIVPVLSGTNDNNTIVEEDFDQLFDDNEDDSYEYQNRILHSNQLANIELILSSLPRNRHWDKTRNNNSNDIKDGDASVLGVIEEPARDPNHQRLNVLTEEAEDEGDSEEGQFDEDKDEDNNKKGPASEGGGASSSDEQSMDTPSSSEVCKIANKATTVNPMRRPSSNVFCHSYDLSRRMSDQITIDPTEYIFNANLNRTSKAIKNDHVPRRLGFELFKQLVTKITDKTKDRTAVVRLLFLQPDLDVLSVTMPLLLAYCRSYSIPIVILICTCRASTNLDSQNELSRSCDYVVTAESFISAHEYPPGGDYKQLRGLLKVVKTTAKTAASSHSLLYGCKRDARKLHLSLLHIQPE
jgi:hypothetical protein